MNLVEVPLGDVADLVRGITFPTSAKKRAAGKGLIPCLRTTNVQGAVEWDDLIYVPDGHVRSEAQRIRPGDILVSMSNSLELVGKCALVTSVPVSATFGAFVAVVRARDGIDPEYVFHAMRSPKFKAHIRSVASTTTNISNINSTKLLASTVVLAGDKTRKSIVSKLDELFSRIDEGEHALERVAKLVERYRQSVLKAAVTGELTRDWREQRKAAGQPIESGEALLARILTTRREAWEQAELAKMQAKGITPKDDAWKKKYKEPAAPDTVYLPELPEGWVWASVEQVGFVTGGLTKNQKRGSHEIQRPYLRVANVYANRLDLRDVHEIGVSESELERVLLEKGDLLVVEGNGSIEQIGRVALWDGSIPDCVHQNHLIKVRCTAGLPPWYVLIWCMSPLGREHIRRVASSTAGLHTLSISKIQSLPIPVPASSELELIRDRFEQMDSIVVNQRAATKAEAVRSAALRQSVLMAAFSGELVVQETADEPASILLERIAAGRAESTTAAPKRGRKKKST